MANLNNQATMTLSVDGQSMDLNATNLNYTVVNGEFTLKLTPDSLNILSGINYLITLTLDNTTELQSDDAPIFNVKLDPAVTYVDGTAKIDGSEVTSAFDSGLLTVTSESVINANSTMVCTFEIKAA